MLDFKKKTRERTQTALVRPWTTIFFFAISPPIFLIIFAQIHSLYITDDLSASYNALIWDKIMRKKLGVELR
jgi:hypothetical protein